MVDFDFLSSSSFLILVPIWELLALAETWRSEKVGARGALTRKVLALIKDGEHSIFYHCGHATRNHNLSRTTAHNATTSTSTINSLYDATSGKSHYKAKIECMSCLTGLGENNHTEGQRGALWMCSD
jgi:hypothetical protein